MRRLLLTTIAALGLPLAGLGADITLTNSDALNSSSFNAKLNWNSDTAPVAGNAYFTGPQFRMRTPASGSSFTFSGDSLTINSTNGLNGGLMYKGTGPSGVLTINNLILDGGWIHHQNGSGDICRIAGNITVLSPSRIDTKQGNIFIDATVSGSGTITNASNDNHANNYTTTYTANNSAFTGRMVITHANNRVQITNENNLGGNPIAFTPDQLLVEAGWLQTGISNDVVLDDSNRGITLNGTWSLNPQSNATLTIVCPITGVGEVWKRGPGVLTLAGDNSTHSGGVRLGSFSAGSQLNVNSATALGVGLFTINNDANEPILDNTSGSAQTISTFNSQAWNRSFTFLGSSSLNLGGGSAALGANVTVTVSNNNLTVGPVVDDGLNRILTKQGPGTLTIDGGGYYLGNTVVNEGVLALTTVGTLSSPVITIATNATLNVAGAGGLTLSFGQTLGGSGTVVGNVADGAGSTTINPGTSPGTLTINGNLALNGGGAVNFELSPTTTAGSGVNDLIVVTGELNLAGATTLNLAGTPGVGTYTLFQYGSFAGSLANLSIPPGFALNNNTADQTIELVVTHVPASLTWQGDGVANAWDLGVTANWIQSGTNQFFFTGDSVTFDNSGSSTPAVTLASDVSPAAVTVNSSQNYTFTGGGITSGSLTKSGTGTLVLDNTNSYSGATVINAGTLQLGDPLGLNGGLAGTIGTGPVTNNGNLLFNRASDLTLPANIHGSGSISNIGFIGGVTLSGNINGGTVTMAGGGSLTLSGSNSYSGATLVTSGTLFARSTNALGSASAGTTVEGGGTLYVDLNQPMEIAAETITLNNGTLRRGGGQALTWGTPVALTGPGTLNVDGNATLNLTNAAGVSGADVGLTLAGGNNGNGTIAGPISLGNGALTVSGGFWNVAATNNYTGKTVLNGGRLLIPELAALGPNPGVATPDFVTFNGGLLAMTNSQTFSGGTRGLTIGTGGTLYAQDAAATITVSGDLNGAGNFTKWGPGTLALSGSNPFSGSVYLDGTSASANDGITRIASPTALANVPVVAGTATIFQGNNNSGWSTLQLDGTAGNITLPQNWSMNCRNNDNPNVQNLAGNNTLSGEIYLNVGGNRAIFQSDAGLLTISGAQQYVGTLTGGRIYTFAGVGNILVSGAILNSTNGAPISLAKNGSGATTLSANNTYGNTTTINAGALLVTGSLTSTGGVSVVGGALGGTGTINDNVSVQSSIGSGTLDSLTVNGNYTINGTLAVDVNRASSASDFTTVNATLSAAAGTVSVNNLGAALQVGDTFTLFNKAVSGGASLNVVGAGATWANNLAVNGTIQVSSLVSTTPVDVEFSLSGDSLTLSWPPSHLGWTLQTNSVSVADSNAWYPVAGSSTTTNLTVTVDPTRTNVYYRIFIPQP